MARTHGLDKRLREEKEQAAMAKHDGGSSITQASVKPSGSAGKPYKSGANVHKGGGKSPSKPAPAAGPKTGKKGY